jgi:hypothetical protein
VGLPVETQRLEAEAKENHDQNALIAKRIG